MMQHRMKEFTMAKEAVRQMPEAQIRETEVIEVTIESVTGKYHR